jgi:predicted CoA-binding protein
MDAAHPHPNHGRRVVVIGASNDRDKYGNKAVRAYKRQGYEVIPVNPHEETIEGLTAYRSISDVPPGPIDRVTMYVPPEIGITLLDEIAARSPEEFFLNPGSESDQLVAAAAAHGLEPLLACSILDIGVTPQIMDE